MEAAKKILKAVWWFPLTPLAMYLVLFFLFMNVAGYLMRLSGSSQVLDLTTELLEALSAVLSMWIIFHFIERRKLSDSGFTPGMPVLDTALGFLGGCALVSAVVLALKIENVYRVSTFTFGFNPTIILITLFFAAVFEEVVFRGFAFLVLEKRLGTAAALICTSLLFGLAHIFNSVQGEDVWHKLIGCFCLALEAGLLLNATFLIRRNLWLPIGVHWAWNFCEGPVFGMTVSGVPMQESYAHAKLIGSNIETGGLFGPEASAAGVIISTICGFAILYYAVKFGSYRLRKEAETPTSSEAGASDQITQF